MSIYATLHVIGVQCFGDDVMREVFVQAVPSHIVETRSPYDFLPPPVDPDGSTPRAVYFVESSDRKGTERCPQEYCSHLLFLTGIEYEQITFSELVRMLELSLNKRYGPFPAYQFL